MKWTRMWLARVMAVVAVLTMAVTPVAAQSVNANLQAAVGGLEDYYGLLDAGLNAQDEAARRARADEALGVALQVRSDLRAALEAGSGSDAVRSRVEAVMGHLDQAINDLREGLSNPDLLAAKTREAQARGCGALDEQVREIIGQPEAVAGKDAAPGVCDADTQAAPGALPNAGGSPMTLPIAVLVGSSLAAGGLAIRLVTHRR